jgi:hypothetical protein
VEAPVGEVRPSASPEISDAGRDFNSATEFSWGVKALEFDPSEAV